MMKNSCLLVIVIGCLSVRTAHAGYGTNSFFITIDDRLTTQESAEIAKTNAECQPAIDDPNGHWGPILFGYELSISFDKEIFQTNAPIIATIIYRNSGTNILNHATPFGGDLDFQFVIKDETGKKLGDSFVPMRTTGHSGGWIPGTQFKYESNLTRRFGLSKPGIYSVSVHRRMQNPSGNGIVYLSSGTATIRIVD